LTDGLAHHDHPVVQGALAQQRIRVGAHVG
jgi:hypothetical protein